jgi:hypothetical protein
VLKRSLLMFAGSAAILVMACAMPACAQDESIPMPDAQAGAPDYQVPSDIGATMPSPTDNGATVIIPIPGGGAVVVQGPDSAADPKIPAMPGANWGSSQIDPNSVGGSPMGPQSDQP